MTRLVHGKNKKLDFQNAYLLLITSYGQNKWCKMLKIRREVFCSDGTEITMLFSGSDLKIKQFPFMILLKKKVIIIIKKKD